MGVEESGVPLRAKLCVEGYGSGSEKQSVEVRRGREEGGGFPQPLLVMEWVRFDRGNKWRERERERGMWWDGRYGVKLQNQNGKPIILVEIWTVPLFKSEV